MEGREFNFRTVSAQEFPILEGWVWELTYDIFCNNVIASQTIATKVPWHFLKNLNSGKIQPGCVTPQKNLVNFQVFQEIQLS